MRKDKLIILLLAAGTSVPIDAQSAAQQPPRGVTEEMRIASSDAIPGMQLTRVSDLQVNDAGLIFVAHGSEYLVRVFDPAGKLLRSFGRRGQGPGEWRGAFDLFGTIGDTILVRDQNTWDLNFYMSDGRLARTWSARSPTRRVMAYLPGNRTMAESEFWSPSGVGSRSKNDSTVDVVLDSTGNTVRRVLRLRVVDEEQLTVRLPMVGDLRGVGYIRAQPFIPRTLTPEDPNGKRGFIVLPTREFAGQPGQIKLITVGMNGVESERIISLQTRRFQAADLEAYVKKSVDGIMPAATQRGVPRANVEKQFRDSLVTTEYLSPAEEVIVGRDGSIWIRPSWSETDWSVVLSGNTPSFSVRVPAGAKVFQVASDKFWAVTPDSDGLPIIARFRMSAR